MTYDIMGEDYEILGEDDLFLAGEDPLDELLDGAYYDDDEDELIMGRGGPRWAAKMRRLGRKAARRGRAKQQRAAVRRAVARKLAKNAALVRDETPSKNRQWIIGLNDGSVAAGAASTITSRPQVVFRPEKYVVGGTNAPNFLITDLKIGKDSQFLNGESVPAEVFSSAAGDGGLDIKFDTAQVNSDISVSVDNQSGAAAAFRSAMTGTAIQ